MHLFTTVIVHLHSDYESKKITQFTVRWKRNIWRTTLDVRARRRLHMPGMVGIDSGDASIQQLPAGFHRVEECMRFRPSGRVANCRHLSWSTTHIECSYVVHFTLPQQHTLCFILRNLIGGNYLIHLKAVLKSSFWTMHHTIIARVVNLIKIQLIN